MTKQTKTTEIKLTWLPKKTFELEITIPQKEVKQDYDKTLNESAKEITLKGFRKGKAPLNVVEQNIDKHKLYEEVIRHLLPSFYQNAIKKHNLRPIASPRIQAVSLPENKDWVFKALSCEAPDINLGNYKEIVKGVNAQQKLWTPGKPKEEKQETEDSYNQKINKIFDELNSHVKVEISDFLIEEEASRSLANLLDEIKKLGLTLEQYLGSKNTTSEELKKSYQTQTEKTLKLEFILQAIVSDQKITVADEEVEKIITATNQKGETANTDPLQKIYLKSILAKRKAIDFLLSL